MNRKIGSFPTNFMVGILVVLVIGPAFTDWNYNNFFMFVMMSIVCTLGLGLVIWVPVCYLLGTIVVFLYMLLRGELGKPLPAAPGGTPPSSPHPVSRNLIAVAQYVAQARALGESDLNIAADLRSRGWKNEQIEQGFDYQRWKESVTAKGAEG